MQTHLHRAEWFLALALAAWFGVTTVPQSWRTLNTDFPNYYITAHLVRTHSATARIYEWVWFQRQKGHLGVQQSFSAMPPLTPFSTLFVYPLTWLPPLAAKHVWLIVNAVLLLASLGMIRLITHLRWSLIALLTAASYPLQRNLLNGQMYVLLLFFLTAALWLYMRDRRIFAGVALACAIGLKLFPALFVLYLVRKRDWRALAGTLLGAAGVFAVSLAAFGWQLHRLYVLQILPRGLRGESTGPYNLTSASFTVLFHRLFLFEPAQNPHPAYQAAWLYPVLMALVQLAIIAPLILLITPREPQHRRTALEFAAVLLACLTLSPLPASYHFVLLFLPIAILVSRTLHDRNYAQLAAVLLLYLAVGFPRWPTQAAPGWSALLHVPRLYALLALYALTLYRLKSPALSFRRLPLASPAWLTALGCLAAASIFFGLRTQRSLRDEFSGQLTLPMQAYLFGQPQATPAGLAFIAMQRSAYRAIPDDDSLSATTDELSQTTLPTLRFIEHVTTTSTLISAAETIPDAEQPIASADGHLLAYLREDHSRATLWLRALTSPSAAQPVTPPALDVLEATFAPDDTLTFAALNASNRPSLYHRDAAGVLTQLPTGESRYPAISPNGQHLAYAAFSQGSWNLRLLDLASGRTLTLTDAPCNHIEPSWADDHTLLFASDCGRAVGLTTLYRRHVLP